MEQGLMRGTAEVTTAGHNRHKGAGYKARSEGETPTVPQRVDDGVREGTERPVSSSPGNN